MSVDLIVYCSRSAMPDPVAWARAIVDAGFPLELDTDFDVDSFTGFLPCRYAGHEAGFEYYSGRIDDADSDAPDGADFSVTFCTGSRMRDLASSVVAAAALCKLTGGALIDPQAGEAFEAAHVLEWAHEQLLEIHVD